MVLINTLTQYISRDRNPNQSLHTGWSRRLLSTLNTSTACTCSAHGACIQSWYLQIPRHLTTKESLGFLVLHTHSHTGGRVAQSVQRLATCSTIRGSNSGGGEVFHTCIDRPWGPPSLLYNGYRVFPAGKDRPKRDADPSSALVRKE